MPLAFSEFRFAIPGCHVVWITADTDYSGDFTITAGVVQETIVILALHFTDFRAARPVRCGDVLGGSFRRNVNMPWK